MCFISNKKYWLSLFDENSFVGIGDFQNESDLIVTFEDYMNMGDIASMKMLFINVIKLNLHY